MEKLPTSRVLGRLLLDLGAITEPELLAGLQEQRRTRERIGEVLRSLTPREREVIELRFGLRDGHPRTLDEVARTYGITRERIRQIEAKALRKLKHPSRSRKLRSFLDT